MGRHKEWRKLVKKLRRKRIRSAEAVRRNEIIQRELEQLENSPTHKAWLYEQELLEEFAKQEEQRLAEERQKQWEAEEVAAQVRWREQQIRLERAYAEKAKQELLIKEEWEREQEKLREEQERKEKEKEEKKRVQEELLQKIDAFISGEADLPASTIVGTETQPGQPVCPFFSKTGACRFKEHCSRNHIRPGISKVLLFTNFYEHFGIHSSLHNEYDTDVGLEYEDSDTYHHFLEFYNDILPEFESCGELRQLKVCCNHEAHLRGNVYVEYYDERNTLKAYQMFQGRFYAGRQLSVSFTSIPSWKKALCGLFHQKKCPKGKTCNFLHVFKNPNNAFRDADFDRLSRHSRDSSTARKQTRSPERWRWSESPERPYYDRSERHSYESSRDRDKRKHRDRSEERYRSRRDKHSIVLKRKRRKQSRSPKRHHKKISSKSLIHQESSGEKNKPSGSKQKSKHKELISSRSQGETSTDKLENSTENKTTTKSSHNLPKEDRTPESG